MKKRCIFIFLTIFVGLSAKTITLEETRSLALENSSSYLAAEAEYKSAVYASWRSFVNLFGTISGTYSWTKIDQGSVMPGNEAENQSYSLSLVQPLFAQGSFWYAYKIKTDTEQMKRLSYLEKEFATISESETKYFSLLLAQRELEIAQTALKSGQESLQQTIIKSKTGARSQVDVLSMESEVKSKEVAFLAKQNSYLQSKNEFCDFLHISSQDLQLADIKMEDYQELFDAGKQVDINNLEDLVTKVVNFGEGRNLSLRSLQEQKQIAEKGKKMAMLRPLPTVSATYSYSKSENYSGSFESGSNTLKLSVSMPISFLPFLDNYFDYQQARYELRRVEAENYTMEMQIKLQIKAAVYTFVSSAKQVAAADLGLSSAKGSFAQNSIRYKNGLLSTADYLNALNAYKSAQLNLEEAKNSFFAARSGLKRLLVIKDDKDLLKLF